MSAGEQASPLALPTALVGFFVFTLRELRAARRQRGWARPLIIRDPGTPTAILAPSSRARRLLEGESAHGGYGW
ncbi:hypothetical protein MRX96_045080 [Rhipicephalus microplus]